MPHFQLDPATNTINGEFMWPQTGNPNFVELPEDDARVVAWRNPPVPVRQIRKSTVIARLLDPQLDQALSLMSNRQKERWRSPDHPVVNVDDAEMLQVLQAVGADPNVVLADE